MPGIPTKFKVAELVFRNLRQSIAAQAAPLNNQDNLPYAYLGVIGARLGDFISACPEKGSGLPNTPYFRIWRPLLQLLAGQPAQNGQPEVTGLYTNLKKIYDTLAKLDKVINDKSKFALIGMMDELNGIQTAIQEIQTQVGNLNNLRQAVGLAVLFAKPDPKVVPSKSWQPRDTLHWSYTGKFLEALDDLAEASNDDRLKAYALGAKVGYAVDVCGNPYINSVVGTSYRNHWWRQRWISNYVDTWVYGYYGKGGSEKVSVNSTGDPSPVYATWPNVCEANLQRWIELPGISVKDMMDSLKNSSAVPAVLPQEFLDFWKEAYVKVYGQPAHGSAVDDDGLQSAYAMTWLILWLQTSAELIPCMPVDQINYPDDCGDRPDWVAEDGTIVTNGQVQNPPNPEPSTSPTWWEIVSGIILAILGALTWNAGAVAAGIAAIVAGAALVADGATEPDWDKFRCYLDWVYVYLYNKTNALHDLFKWAGLGFPYTLDLTHNPLYFQLTGSVMPVDAALNTVRSRPANDNYPAQVWNPVASDWIKYVNGPLEKPVENAYPFKGQTWPYHFTDGLSYNTPPAAATQNNPLTSLPGRSPLIRDEVEWNARLGTLNTAKAVSKFFGNALDVSLELILHAQAKELLDWDLDGDPGYGFPTWVLPAAGSSRSSSIPEP
jgi:hypothetical protein